MLPIILAIITVSLSILIAAAIPNILDLFAKREAEIAGNLIVALDPDDGPYVFLEMHQDFNYILSHKTVSLRVVRSKNKSFNGNDVDSKEVKDD